MEQRPFRGTETVLVQSVVLVTLFWHVRMPWLQVVCYSDLAQVAPESASGRTLQIQSTFRAASGVSVNSALLREREALGEAVQIARYLRGTCQCGQTCLH
mmetsp:Transcript_56710/g.132851  ORF Transcript_56710/g.132851 Transcript_56710/m.132851 type:complete len:100 (-) Transcript_56710:131-430(-)|eukprot:1901475-Rhodomonas_salina.1